MASKTKTVKNTAVADTSIMAYIEICDDGLIQRENELVLKIMKEIDEPVTSRRLMNITHKERGNLCRVLYNLERSNKIVISGKGKCEITNKTVRYYSLNPAA